jgi:hypothetical protein
LSVSRSSVALAHVLSKDERRRFETEGWLGPYPLLASEEARALESDLVEAFERTRGYFYPDRAELQRCYAGGVSFYEDTPWFQSLHALSPQLLAVGRRAGVVERVAQLIGDDVMLWATICFLQGAGERLHWHSDNEFHHVSGVSVWMGAANTSPENALKLMPGSHRFPQRPEHFLSAGRETMETLQEDERALSLARAWSASAEVVRPAVRDGEFILFDGTLWHASDNPRPARRCAMGLRFSPPSERVRIPMTAWEPTIWDPAAPPTVLVRGEDRYGVNPRMVRAEGLRASR